MRDIKVVNLTHKETFQPMVCIEVDGEKTKIGFSLESIQDFKVFRSESFLVELKKLFIEELIIKFEPTADEEIMWGKYLMNVLENPING